MLQHSILIIIRVVIRSEIKLGEYTSVQKFLLEKNTSDIISAVFAGGSGEFNPLHKIANSPNQTSHNKQGVDCNPSAEFPCFIAY